jgi:tight adherence protein B
VGSPAPALALLLGVLAVGLLGLRELLGESARQAQLRERARGARDPSPLAALAARARRAFARTALGRRIGFGLQATGVELSPLGFALAAVAGAVLVGAAASLYVGRVAAVIAALLALRGALAWLDFKREQRREKFVGQLPDLARVLSNSASAGLSIVGALEVAVQELDAPAGEELSQCLEEIRIGQSFDRAFEHLAERMPSRELGVLVSTLVIQQRSGGDIVHALSDMSTTLEQRKDTLREVKTLMSGAVATAYVVAGLGPVSLLLFDLIQPGSLDALTGSVIGVLILIVAGALYALGLLVIRRMTRVET